jgi:O-acetyl-ADP-ribose deacetylase (regulator of RNase III)
MDTLSNEEHESLLLMSEHAIAAPLSLAAQAVLNAAEPCDELEGAVAAALRAAADAVVPDEITWASPKEQARHYPSAEQRAGEQDMASVVRRQLLAIAAELEGNV